LRQESALKTINAWFAWNFILTLCNAKMRNVELIFAELALSKTNNMEISVQVAQMKYKLLNYLQEKRNN